MSRSSDRCMFAMKEFILTTILTLSFGSCTGHDNPFDPKNDLNGRPFQLKAETGFAKVILDWNWPTYPPNDGDPIPIDSFLIYREDPSNRIDTLRPNLQTTFQDTSVIGNVVYRYQIAAHRKGQSTDFSRSASALAFPLPLECFPIANTNTNEKWVIGFSNEIKFLAEGQFIRALDANDNEVAFNTLCQDFNANCTQASDVVIVDDKLSNGAYVYFCSEFSRVVSGFYWNGQSLKSTCETKSIKNPRLMAVDTTKGRIYVADGITSEIFKLSTDNCEATLTNLRTGLDPRRMTVSSSRRLLLLANKGSNVVSAFDLDNESLLGEIAVNAGPVDLWMGTDSNLYVACEQGTIDVIDISRLETINEILIRNPETGQTLEPKSVSGFADKEGRHQGVFVVAAACKSGDFCDSPGFLLYYSVSDGKFQGYLKLPSAANPGKSSFITRVNDYEERIYTVLPDQVWVCKNRENRQTD